jgi:hypothetical protein
VALRGPKTEGAMAPDVSLDRQRPAEYVFSRHVQQAMEKIKHNKTSMANAEAAE